MRLSSGIALLLLAAVAAYAVWHSRIIYLSPTAVVGKDSQGNDRVAACSVDRWTQELRCIVEPAHDLVKFREEARQFNDKAVGPYAPLRMGKDQAK